MIRRSLKIGVRLGVLAGAVITAAKLIQSWRAPARTDNDSGGRLAVPRPLHQPQSQPAPAASPVPSGAQTPAAPSAEVEPGAADLPVPRPAAEPQLVSPTMLESVSNRAPAVDQPARRNAEPNGDRAMASAQSAPTGIVESPAAAKAKAQAKTKPKAVPQAWIEPQGTTCPTSHPVKGKLKSKLFHLPGMLAYERTHPDRCYLDEASAEADGLTKAKR